MFVRYLALSYVLVCVTAIHAQPGDHGKHLARFLDEQTFLVGSIDTARVDVPALFAKVRQLLPVTEPQARGGEEYLAGIKDALSKAKSTRLYILVGSTELNDSVTLMLPLQDATQAESLTKLLGPITQLGRPLNAATTGKMVDGHLIIGRTRNVEHRITAKPVARPELEQALASVGEKPVQLLLLPTGDVRRVLEETSPRLPAEMGGQPITVLTRGLQWASFAGELPPRFMARVQVQASGVGQAKELEQLWKNILTLMKKESEEKSRGSDALKVIHHLLESVPVQVKGQTLLAEADAGKLETFTQTLARSISEVNADVLIANNLRQMVIAMHTFHADFNFLPNQAICDKAGKPLLSWRVAMLPYLDQGELYKQFKLDESWDSDHNKKLIDKMPRIYVHPLAKNAPAHHTLYQVFYSQKGTKPGAALLESGKITLVILTVQDGTSNTFFVTDAAATAVPWTKPADLLFDGTVNNLPKLASPRGDGWAHVCFGDGHVSRFKIGVDPKLLRQMIGRNDGENRDTAKLFK